jgi:ribosome-binding factor A
MARQSRNPAIDSVAQPGQRQLRVGEELRHALAQWLRPGQLRDPALADANITVTEVRLSPDMRNATAFVMPLGGDKANEIIAGLGRCAPFLKSRIARAVAMRRVPDLAFVLDHAFESAERIAGILASSAVARDLPPAEETGDDTE